jgi:glycosyltransferase involved in cell wall biosynthesis
LRVAVATVDVPFVWGGAESLTEGLLAAMRRAGHEVDLVTMPFRFAPVGQVERAMRIWQEEDLGRIDSRPPDRLICLKFPSYYAAHPNKVTWLIHQHRSAYDLWGTSHDGGLSSLPAGRSLKQEIVEKDNKALRECREVYTISQRVSERLTKYNGIDSQPIYHPPRLADRLYSAPAQPFIFFPSRLEGLKRQMLLIEAMAHVRSSVVVLLAGEGGQRPELERRIEELGLGDRVHLLGHVSDQEMLGYYAHCLATFFGPYDEDLGLVTLEAMLARKPVITCRDSGEPTRFVADGETGFVVAPEPEAVAAAIEEIARNPGAANSMGEVGRAHYDALDISWDHVVAALLS